MTITNISRMNRQRASTGVVFGDVEYRPGGAFGPRVQQDFQLVIVYAGEARIWIDGHAHDVGSEHAMLLQPQRIEQFQFARNRPTHHTWCAVAPQLVSDQMRTQLAQLPGCVPLTNRIHSMVEYGLGIPLSETATGGALLEAVGIAVLHTFVFEAELAHHSAHVPVAVLRAQQYIETHLADPLRLPQIAHAVGVTPQHLTRLFRRFVQTTPTRYLWQVRTRRGVEMLGATGLSVSEIAAQSGFQSPFHFSRMVRQHYHASPRQLRERLWRGEKAEA